MAHEHIWCVGGAALDIRLLTSRENVCGCVSLSYITMLILAYPWAGLQDKLACTQRLARSLCSHPNPFSFGRITSTGRDPTYRWGLSPGPQEFTPSDCAGHLANQRMELTNSKRVDGEGEQFVSRFSLPRYCNGCHRACRRERGRASPSVN